MSEGTSIPLEPIRVVFELERADNPHLYDDLIRFKKGTKRVNRLRTLAQDGLHAQALPRGLAGQAAQFTPEMAAREAGDPVINKVFEEPVTE